jgi:hypothetical protein
MSIQAALSHLMHGFMDTIRRNAIAYSICALCGLAVLILATGAAVMALIPLVGAVYAQLIVAAFFLLVIVGTMFWLQRPVRQARQAAARAVPVGAAADANQRQAQFAQIAMIIEAVMLGYSMSRRR